MSKNITIIGGHGKVALRLARLLSTANKTVHSVIRDEAQSDGIRRAGAKPVVLSLENDSTDKFTKQFADTKTDLVYFCAGAGGKGGKERTKKVDYEGAVKIFDAIEGVKQQGAQKNPRLVLVSAIDIRNPDKIPEHYDEEDRKMSETFRGTIGDYMHWKYEADKDLVQRKAFDWTILRPGILSDEPGTGKASVGRTHLSPPIARDDVALALFLLSDRPEAAGLSIDLVGGETPVIEGLDAFISRGVTDWLG
ncbi:NADH(P)-binding-domain-containing protein [Ephemerocybe angulata]|uniref:NADH(P)-binding-domain-containing protein n=1 Tax=Ephemerocybe angulata TaxID=980116 RepID=A0A8H6HD58_9AGAR|nr:NADH(P)-binding-domain-containing protein [Tulosesus angulatus]